jgi:hypothetical protein
VAQENPFSITLAFPHLDTPEFPRALALARESSGFEQTGAGAATRYRARFLVADAARLLDVFNVVQHASTTEVLVDDQAVPYGRELWIPLVSFFIDT